MVYKYQKRQLFELPFYMVFSNNRKIIYEDLIS